jgi:Asp-tRNA(Asn)/Glu-tRNA(Gln) amidotransferase A subunit family amidase
MAGMTELHELGATELASRIRRREVSPVDVVEALIARIEAVNPAINAVVTTSYARARREAREAAEALARGDRGGPLMGVPFTIKDCHATEGVRSTSGLVARRSHVPSRDGEPVARLRAAGAILLGKTNLADNCWSGETVNLVFGRTNNPWDLTRTVGGSSGGSAAVVAACGVPFDVGSDIGGSIRLPAFYTGVVGLRATSGTVPEEGIWPPTVGRLADLEAIGPLARRVEDAALVHDVLRGSAPEALAPARLSGTRLAAWYGDGSVECDDDVRAAVDASARALERAGMVRVAGAPEARRRAMLGWAAYLGEAELEAVSTAFGGGERWGPLAEAWRSASGRARVSTPALVAWVASHLGSPLARHLVDADRWRARLRAQVRELIGPGGVAVCAVRPSPAPRHGLWSSTLVASRVSGMHAWVNLAGLPALHVPTGISREGLPVGVQIVGNPGADRTVLAAGLVIERQLAPEWRRPTSTRWPEGPSAARAPDRRARP